MSRTYKRRPDARLCGSNSLQNLEAALAEIKSSRINLHSTAEKYGIDKMKLSCLMNNKHQKKPGGQTVLTNEEEIALVQNLLRASSWGFPSTEYDIRLLIKCYLDQQGKKVKSFQHNLPGKDWVKSFLNHHRCVLSVRLANNNKCCHAKVSPEARLIQGT
ncbi:hypothetical protein PR048_022666 [Dryococelus australis]|uniref:HTH CENPB-type domain-containing protein n=1 Tax=Dryococelus australis TaxID=614101 RepID=A0ABQ9H1Z0_9NEOP|nr:hypothetical protein PR048_022666 [Dryococelus australis]